MKALIKFSLVFLLLVAVFPQFGFAEQNNTDPPRTTISLDGDWDFTYSSSTSRDENQNFSPVLPKKEEYTAKMPVPGFWDDNWDNLRKSKFWTTALFNPTYRLIEFPYPIDGGNPPTMQYPYLMGNGFYRKLIDIPSDWAGRNFTLNVGGVRFESWVWLNGKFVGYNNMHNIPFSLSLKDFVNTGAQNEIIIVVANNGQLRPGSFARGFMQGAAGIYRSVILDVCGSARIASCYIYPLQTNKKLKWNVDIEGDLAKDSYLDYSIIDKDGKIVGKGTEPVDKSICSWQTQTFGIKPWSDLEPNLYKIQVSLRQANKVSDSISQSFGMRTIARDGIKLRLNGKPILLRGTGSNYQATDRDVHANYEFNKWSIDVSKKLGFNWTRFHTTIPPEEYMQAADELGMMLEVEGTGDYSKKDWEEVLRVCRKHPSVILYCCGNEEKIDEEKIEYLCEVAALQKTLAPDGLFNPMQALSGVEYGIEKSPPVNAGDYVERPYPHNVSRLNALKEFSDVFGQYSWGKLSYVAVHGDWKNLNKMMTPYERPLLSHENGICGSYIDLNLEHRYDGTAMGPQLYKSAREYIQKEGLIARADTYFKNSCNWQRLIHKYNLEMTRKCKYVMGYDFHNLTDRQKGGLIAYHCGMMNEFCELKPGNTTADILTYNGESVVLLDCYTNRNLYSGQTVSYDAMSSLYGMNSIKEGRLDWWLSNSDTNKTYTRGFINLHNVRVAEVEKLGAINFIVPMLDKPVKTTLHVKLSGGEYDLVNSWNFWVFPKNDSSENKAYADEGIMNKFGKQFKGLQNVKNNTDLRVLSTLNDDSLKFLNEGGRIVFLGSNPFPSLVTTFRLQSSGRVQGNFSTVILDHPLMNSIPNDGYCDWQLSPMMEDGSAITFNDSTIPFNPIVEVVSSFEHIIKQGSIFEFNVGNGRLLVCSMRLDTTDPGANYLLHSMIDYANSQYFKPKDSISLNQLLKWIGKGYVTGTVAGPGMADDPSFVKK